MALQLKDRVRTACTTIGKAEIEIGAVRAGYQNWDGITDGNTVYYCVVEGNKWEVGYGVKTGTEITRNLLSSSTGSLLSLDGTSDVFETYPAEKAVILNTDGNIELPSSNIKANKFVGDGSELTNIPTSADTYTKTEIDDQQDAQDADIVINNDEIARQQIEITNNTGNISSNTTAIGTLSGQVAQNSEDIAELQDSIFFTSAYSADYPSAPNRDPEDGNMYLQKFALFTYSYADATQIFCSKTDESGNVRQFTAVKAGDSIVLNEVDSPNYGRYELVSVADVSDSYVVMNVIPKLGQGTVITGAKVAFQAFPKVGIWDEVDGEAVYDGDIEVNGVTVGKGSSSGDFNTVVGESAMPSSSSASGATAIGYKAGFSSTDQGTITAVGYQAIMKNTEGYYLTGVGNSALTLNTLGVANTATGYASLAKNTEGDYNTALGKQSLYTNTKGNNNTAIGSDALKENIEGSNHTAVGNSAGSTLTGGSNNLFLGNNAQPSSPTVSNEVTIGNVNVDKVRMGNGDILYPGAGATGGGKDEVFQENERVVTTDYTLTTNKSAMSVGPVTINTGVTVTIPSGESWVVL